MSFGQSELWDLAWLPDRWMDPGFAGCNLCLTERDWEMILERLQWQHGISEGNSMRQCKWRCKLNQIVVAHVLVGWVGLHAMFFGMGRGAGARTRGELNFCECDAEWVVGSHERILAIGHVSLLKTLRAQATDFDQNLFDGMGNEQCGQWVLPLLKMTVQHGTFELFWSGGRNGFKLAQRAHWKMTLREDQANSSGNKDNQETDKQEAKGVDNGQSSHSWQSKFQAQGAWELEQRESSSEPERLERQKKLNVWALWKWSGWHGQDGVDWFALLALQCGLGQVMVVALALKLELVKSLSSSGEEMDGGMMMRWCTTTACHWLEICGQLVCDCAFGDGHRVIEQWCTMRSRLQMRNSGPNAWWQWCELWVETVTGMKECVRWWMELMSWLVVVCLLLDGGLAGWDMDGWLSCDFVPLWWWPTQVGAACVSVGGLGK